MNAHLIGAQSVRTQKPLASMFGYATDLRSRTQCCATFTMHLATIKACLRHWLTKSQKAILNLLLA